MKQKHQPIIVGHRGASGYAPDNTIISYKKALEHGAVIVETDARLSRDGVVVLVHDEIIHDSDGAAVTIATTDYQQLKAHRSDLATLHELIGFLDRHARLIIEVKPAVPVRRIVQVVTNYLHHGWEPTDFMFSSFDYQVLKQLRKLLPEVEVMVLDEWSGVRATSRARRLHTTYVGMNDRWLWSGFVRSISRRYKLYAYTINDPKRGQHLVKHGLYGIITNYPDYFLAPASAIVEEHASHTSSHRGTHRQH